MLRPERKRGMAKVFVEGRNFEMKRVIRKVSHPPLALGRVNHGFSPLGKWWWCGFERSPRQWAQYRVWSGASAIVFPRPPSHEMRREAMLWAWDNHQENLAERGVSSYAPRTAEFHLSGMSYWLVLKRMEARRRRGLVERPWFGPRFRRALRQPAPAI